MRALRPTIPSALLRVVAAVAVLLVAGTGAPAAQAHGGSTVVEGSKSGVTILVQSAASQTKSGGPAVDLSTLLNGPGTGKATVDYWIRPTGKKAFKVETERDAGGTYHVDISTAERGEAADWDVSAIVTLGDGERLRVTNAPDDAPGPDVSKPASAPDSNAADASDAPTEPTLTEGNPPPSTPTASTPAAADDATPIDDVSGEKDGPPAWAFPSLLVLTVIGLAILAVKRRGPQIRE